MADGDVDSELVPGEAVVAQEDTSDPVTVERAIDPETRPDRWAGWGWSVSPGTLVRVQVNPLEQLFDEIGQQMRSQSLALHELRRTVTSQGDDIERLQQQNSECEEARRQSDERVKALEDQVQQLSDSLVELGGRPVHSPRPDHSDAIDSIDKRFRDFQRWVVQSNADDVERRTSDLDAHVRAGSEAVREWNAAMDELNLEEAEGDTGKLRELLKQWSVLQRDVESRVREAGTSRQILQASVQQLQRWQVRDAAEEGGAAGGDGADAAGEDGKGSDDAAGDAAASGDGGDGDDGGDGEGGDGDGGDGGEGGAGVVTTDVVSAATPVYAAVDQLESDAALARERLAGLLGSFTVGHTTYVTRRLTETTVKTVDAAVGTVREEFDTKLDKQHVDHVELVHTSIERVRKEIPKTAPRRKSSAAATALPPPEPVAERLSGANIVTKEDFDLVVQALERVGGQAKANTEGVGSNGDRLESTEEEVKGVTDALPPIVADVDGLKNDTEQMQLTINKLERMLMELQSLPPPEPSAPGAPPSEAALRRMQSQLVAHSNRIEDLFQKLQTLPQPRGGGTDDETKAITDAIKRTLSEHGEKLSDILTRQADAETKLASQIKRKASLSGLQNVAHEVSRKADESKVNVALQDKIGRELLNKMLDDYMASLDKRLDAVCSTVRDERQSEVNELKRRFQRLLRDAIQKAMEENQMGGGVDPGSKSRFGRVKIQFCAGCDRPVSQIVGVPVPTVPHQRLPAPHNVSDDFVYRGGGFRVPSRQQRLAAQEEALSGRGWDSPKSRPRSASYKAGRGTPSSRGTPARREPPSPMRTPAWDDRRPATAPHPEGPGTGRSGSTRNSSSTMRHGSHAAGYGRGGGDAHSTALADGGPRRSMAQYSARQI